MRDVYDDGAKNHLSKTKKGIKNDIFLFLPNIPFFKIDGVFLLYKFFG